MTTQIYATQVTAYYLAALASYEAGGAALNIAGGTLLVGDGNGSVPSISALIAANGVTHQVWSGQTINSVSVDPSNPNQLDIACEIPAAIGGAEIGPFNVTEFAILDVTGACCVVGTTNLQKTTSGEGQTSDLAWIAAIVCSVAGSVTVTPPSAGYATMAQVIAGYDANLPGVAAPITKTDTVNSAGWTNRVIGIASASQPADPVTPTWSAAALGAGRPASAAEYVAGAPTGGGFAWPWPTLQQVAASFASAASAIAAIGASLAGYLLKSGGTMTGALVLAADPTAAAQAATKHYVDASIAGVSGFLPEAGGTMTGALTLAADPTEPLEAATKEYVDNAVAGENPFTTTGIGAVLQLGLDYWAAGPATDLGTYLGTYGSLVYGTDPDGSGGAAGIYSSPGANWPFSESFQQMLRGVDARWPSSSPPGIWTIISVAGVPAATGGQTVWLRRTE